MKTSSRASSLLLGVLLSLASSQVAAQTAPPPNPPPQPPPANRLAFRPQPLSLISVPGAAVYVSNGLRLFMINGPVGTGVDNPNVDEAALRSKAIACAQGQGCGTVVSAQTANAVYDWIEAGAWYPMRLDNYLTGFQVTSGATLVLAPAVGDLPTAVEALIVHGRICDGPAQPQCPPGGTPGPRFPVDLRQLQLGYFYKPLLLPR